MEGSFKDFYDVVLKATYPIKIGERFIETGEIIASFNSIKIAGLSENMNFIAASGGYGNTDRVFWNIPKSTPLTFSQGVFSPEQFAIMSNARLVDIQNTESILITQMEELESNEDGMFILKKTPVSNLYVYKKSTGEKLEIVSRSIDPLTQKTRIEIEDAFIDVCVHYEYNYNNGAKIIKIGQQLINGFVSLEGKTRIKDGNNGEVVTGLIKIPKLKILSKIDLRLGDVSAPHVGIFYGEAVPIGNRGNNYVSEFYFLNSYIDSDL